MTREESFKFGRDQLVKELNIKNSELKVTSQYQDASGTVHIYAVRTYGEIEVDNQNAAIHLKNGQVQSISHSFSLSEPPKLFAQPKKISLEEAVKSAEEKFGIKRDEIPEKTVYIQVPSGSLVESYQFQLRDDSLAKFYQVSVDKSSGQVIQVVDYVLKASFNVIKFTKHNPNDGFESLNDPAYDGSSPKGWNNDGTTEYQETQGNNVKSTLSGNTIKSSSGLDFDSKFDPSKDFDSTDNQRAAVINNFYCI